MRGSIRAFIAILILLPILWFSHQITQNNMESEISRAELQASLHKGIDWLEANKHSVMKNHNSALWWMMQRASVQTDEARLTAFFDEYKRTEYDWLPNSLWTGFMDPDYRTKIPALEEMDDLRDYQLFLLYSFYCDRALGEQTIIQQQLNSDYCPTILRSPACLTHQLIAVRLLQRRECGDHQALASDLLDQLERIMFWDFRAADAYIQRALMLAESERALRSGWVRAILDAQHTDGGWSDFYPVLSIGSWQPGLTSKWPTTGPVNSDFHATAQGVWLMVLLLDQQWTAKPSSQ